MNKQNSALHMPCQTHTRAPCSRVLSVRGDLLAQARDQS
jgi:hypothetical protein